MAPDERTIAPGTCVTSPPTASVCANIGSETSASPAIATSIQLMDFMSAGPMSASTLAPPKTMVTCGYRSLMARLSAREATFCSKVEENPTIAY